MTTSFRVAPTGGWTLLTLKVRRGDTVFSNAHLIPLSDMKEPVGALFHVMDMLAQELGIDGEDVW